MRRGDGADDEILGGYDHVAMPAFDLPRSQLDALVAYLASLSDRGAAVMPADPYVDGGLGDGAP